MKTITFDGRIGAKGAEVLKTNGGKPYVRFSVANNSFVGGQDQTEWFDVISYDPYVIEKRVQYLTKGTYVIISGGVTTKVRVGKDNNIYVNQNVTAATIDTPSFKKKEDDEQTTASTTSSEPVMSTYTASTVTEVSKPAPVPTPTPTPEPAYSTVGAYDTNDENDDDLPF